MDVGTNGGSVWVCYRTLDTVKVCVYVVQIIVCAYVQQGWGVCLNMCLRGSTNLCGKRKGMGGHGSVHGRCA